MLPAIVSDIDGVIFRGSNIIKGSDLVLKALLNNKFLINNKPFKFPFVCLTNGGGYLESDKASSMNKILNNPLIKLNRNHIILNFTPLRPILNVIIINYSILNWQKFEQTISLISGTGNTEKIAQDCGLKRFITIQDYAAIFPLTDYRQTPFDKELVLKKLFIRFEVKSKSELQKKLQEIGGIFILHDVVFWEESLTAMFQILSQSKKKIPIYVVNNDITYADSFRLARFAFGPYTYVLKSLYKKMFGKELDITYYGKPTKNTYQYTCNEYLFFQIKEHYLQSKYDGKIGNFYMIGDNPTSDIRGANLAGWNSILVRSGVFTGRDNDKNDPAKFVVDNMEQAFELICKRENIVQIL